MQWIAVHCEDFEDDGNTFESESVRQAFAKSLLIAGDIWGKRVYTGKLDEACDDVNLLRRKSLGATRAGVEAAISGLDPMIAISRGRAMFRDIMPEFRKAFDAQFESIIGVDLEAFFGLLSVIAICCMVRSPTEGGPAKTTAGIFRRGELEGLSAGLRSIFDKVSKHVGQSPEELTSSIKRVLVDGGCPGSMRGLSVIRQRPFMCTPDGRCIVLDPHFFAQLASIGPLFALFRQYPPEECFEQFGHTFERYASMMLRRMYPKPPEPLFDRLRAPLDGTSLDGNAVQLADAALCDVSGSVLIEMKASWLRDDLADSTDFSEYLSGVRERYARGSIEGQPKGVGQLAQAITKLADEQWMPNESNLLASPTIYPVLLCYDEVLGSVTHPWFLAEEFRRLLEPDGKAIDGSMTKGKFRVANLIVLTIEMLECLEVSIESFSLIDLLHDYSLECADRVEALRTYVWRSKYGQMLFANRSLAQQGLATLRHVRKLTE